MIDSLFLIYYIFQFDILHWQRRWKKSTKCQKHWLQLDIWQRKSMGKIRYRWQRGLWAEHESCESILPLVKICSSFSEKSPSLAATEVTEHVKWITYGWRRLFVNIQYLGGETYSQLNIEKHSPQHQGTRHTKSSNDGTWHHQWTR